MVELLDRAYSALCLHAFHPESVVDGEHRVAFVVEHLEPGNIFLVAALSALESASEDKYDRWFLVAVQSGLASGRGEIFIEEK